MIEGYTKEKLEELCSENNLQIGCNHSKFWVSEIYGLGRAYREYAYFYPKSMPLYVYSAHGVYFFDSPCKHELESEATVQLYSWDKYVKEFKQQSKKPCYQVEWPYLYYVKKRGVKRVENPKGTIVYPAHSTPLLEETFDIKNYIEQLKSLPEKFHPIYICLHKHDIDKGVHNVYLDAGFSVVTAGNFGDDRFVDRFYEILKHFKYSTSNEIYTCTFLSVNFGVPFFAYGENSKTINYEDPNYEKGEFKFQNIDGYQEAYELFLRNPFEDEIEISKEQIDYVNDKLGVGADMSRLKFTLLLWWAFFSYRFNPVRMLVKFFKAK